MKTRQRFLCCGLIIGCLGIGGVSDLHALNWTKNTVGTHDWTNGSNWAGGIAPAATESGNILFSLNSGSTYIVRLDTTGNQILKGGLTFNATITNPGTVNLDLQNKNLILDGGSLIFSSNSSPAAPRTGVTISSGTLKLGTEENAASLTMGASVGNQVSTGYSIVFSNSATLDTSHTNDINIAANSANYHQVYTLDLSAATLTSADAVAFSASGSVRIGESQVAGPTSGRSKVGTLKLGIVSQVEVAQNLVVGQNLRTTAALNEATGTLQFATEGQGAAHLHVGHDLRIGVGAGATGNITNAPAVLDVTIGSAGTPLEDRGSVYVGYKDKNYAGNASGLFTTTEGTFSAYLKELRIGENVATTGTANGVLNFGALTTGTLQISGDAVIGKGANSIGSFSLKDGVASSNNLTVGVTTDAAKSTLDLDGTIWNVNNTLLVGANGLIEINVDGNSAGIDLSSSNPVNLTITTGGVLAFQFDVEATTETIWGLRMSGDQTALFSNYISAGAFTTSGLFESNAAVFYDGTYTYYGLAAIPESSTVALCFLGGILSLLFRNRKLKVA